MSNHSEREPYIPSNENTSDQNNESKVEKEKSLETLKLSLDLTMNKEFPDWFSRNRFTAGVGWEEGEIDTLMFTLIYEIRESEKYLKEKKNELNESSSDQSPQNKTLHDLKEKIYQHALRRVINLKSLFQKMEAQILEDVDYPAKGVY
jgi:predicted  nucleic acid-binding Zn-ribbon protein